MATVNRVDPDTMTCKHDVEACVVCMVDDFHDWVWDRKARRAALKVEWRDTPVHERFDLGGEA